VAAAKGGAMIASRIGVLVAAALAVVLAVIVIIDRPSQAVTTRALAGGFDTQTLSRLAWTRAGEPEVVIERAGDAWQWKQPIAGQPADAAVVDATIAALRGGRWHRRAPLAQAGALRVALHATNARGQLRIGIGQPLAGAGQTWVAIGDDALLVDDWVARALAPAPLALRDTRPLRAAPDAKTIVIDRVMPAKLAVRLEGPRLVRPIELRLDPKQLAPLHDALAKLTIRSIPTTVDPAILMTISIDTPKLVTLEVRGAGCGDDAIAISGTFGHACISADDLRAIENAIDVLGAPAITLADRVPARIDPVRITLPDGGVLDLEKRPRIGDHDADPAAIAELLVVLQTGVEAVERDPASPVQARMVITGRAETIELELLPDKHVRRKGEPIALRVGDGAWKILTRPSTALRDATAWTEDELTIQSITIDNTTYTRGAVVGEWTGGKDLTALARALAKPRLVDTPRAPGRTWTLSFTTVPPAGAPVTRTLQVGKNCIAIVDGKSVVMEPALCDAVGEVLP
jgi:hypothetical protein